MALLPLDEARRHVLERCPPAAPVTRALAEAAGCVLAEPVVAAGPIPPFANTAMDGFAVRAADTAGAGDEAPVELRIVGTMRAGMAPDAALDRPLGPGEALRIMTGAPMPPGADAVVPVEVTRTEGDVVAVSLEAEPGRHVRPAGDDLRPGDEVFAPGTVLGPAHLGVLAGVGRAEVLVHRRPLVGVFSTGDELVPVGRPLAPGQIHDSNRLALLAALAEAGLPTVDLGLIADDEGAIADAVADGVARCDAVVTSGGVSMGDFDYVKVVLDRVGDMRWMQVAIKPAKPLAFGTVARAHARAHDRADDRADDRANRSDVVPVFGLPGNPVSSLVSFELFARPGLRRLAGHADGDLDRPLVSAVADEALRRRPDGKTHFVRAVCRWDAGTATYRVASAGAQGSHQLTAMADADALVVLPDGDGAAVGDRVDIRLLGHR